MRKYNKEVNLDIEITPEEVLLVREGLNKTVAFAVSQMIDKNREPIFEKVKTIHKRVAHALGNSKADGEGMPLDYLLSLESEFPRIHSEKILNSYLYRYSTIAARKIAVVRCDNGVGYPFRLSAAANWVQGHVGLTSIAKAFGGQV